MPEYKRKNRLICCFTTEREFYMSFNHFYAQPRNTISPYLFLYCQNLFIPSYDMIAHFLCMKNKFYKNEIKYNYWSYVC